MVFFSGRAIAGIQVKSMKKTMIFLMGCWLAVGSAQTAAGGDPVRGEKLSKACVQCHGKTGVSPAPNFPILAGQHEDYLLHTLQGYKSGARQNPVMKGMAAGLSEQDMEDLAAYFANQEGLETINTLD